MAKPTPKAKFSTNTKQAPQAQTNVSKQVIARPWYILWLVIIITIVSFSSSIDNEFVNWDDDRNFYENPLVRDINSNNFWKNTSQIFQSGVIGNYNPLTTWTFAIEKMVWGLDKPMYWHVDNLVLHLIAVSLVFYIVILLGLGWQGAALVALLFGIHPMRVESVAWVTERKDVLFGVFYLTAMYQYIKLKIDAKRIRWFYLTLFFVLSLFSKIQAVSFPLTMMAIDYYMDHKWTFKTIVNKIPFFALSLVFGIVGIYMLKDFGSLSSAADTVQFSFIQRLFLGAFSFIVYLVKFIIPYEMAPLYPYPATFPNYYYPAILAGPVVLYVLYYTYVKEKKSLFFGLIFFIVNIVFLLQILGAGQGYLADRFTYIAYFGLFFIVGYYFDQWLTNRKDKTTLLYSISGVYLMLLMFMTFQQNKIWQNSGTLWSHVLEYTKETTLPYGNRANYYRDKGMYKEALSDYNTAIAMKDEQPQAYNSRAKLFFTLAKSRDTLLLALRDYNKAIEYEPKDGEFRVNRGATYARLEDYDNALKDFTEGLALKPDHEVGYLNRSIIYQAVGNLEASVKDIDSYLALNPNNADIWYEKGRALRLLERPQEAIAAYNQAVKFNNNNTGLYYYERSRTYFGLGDMPNARADYQKSLQYNFKATDPAYPSQLGL